LQAWNWYQRLGSFEIGVSEAWKIAICVSEAWKFRISIQKLESSMELDPEAQKLENLFQKLGIGFRS
jgi:hypothetical protein